MKSDKNKKLCSNIRHNTTVKCIWEVTIALIANNLKTKWVDLFLFLLDIINRYDMKPSCGCLSSISLFLLEWLVSYIYSKVSVNPHVHKCLHLSYLSEPAINFQFPISYFQTEHTLCSLVWLIYFSVNTIR